MLRIFEFENRDNTTHGILWYFRSLEVLNPNQIIDSFEEASTSSCQLEALWKSLSRL